MNKFVQRNINDLKRLKQKNVSENTSQANKKRIDELIKLYSNRKITNVATAENLIKGLTSDNKKTYDKAFQKYKDNIKKFKESKPLNQRMAETKERKKKKTYLINFMLYTIRDPKKQTIKPAFVIDGNSYYIDSFDSKTATITVDEFPTEVIGKRVLKVLKSRNALDRIYSPKYQDEIRKKIEDGTIPEPELPNPEFRALKELLKEDEEFKGFIEWLEGMGYGNSFDAIKITNVEVIDKAGKKIDVKNENLRDTTNVSIFHRYVNTPVALQAETIGEAIKKGHHVENECWINSLLDFYSDTLMNEKRKNRLTREKVIEIIGRDDIKVKGITINEMEPVFKEFRISVRIYDYFNRLIYSFNPEVRHHHLKTFYAMVKNNHIYTLNHDLKSIQQKQNDVFNPVVKASTDYYLNETEKPPEFRMINKVDDILKLKIDEKEVNIVLENNNLTEAFFELVKYGYEPRINFQAGIITGIRMKLNKVLYNIKTQNLVKTSVDGCIVVKNEKIYNKLSQAMFDFNKSLFNPLHKSFYNEIDIAILDEARTIVPVGLLCDKVPKEIVEIDISKAFTSAFMKIKEIPVFNQFDTWKVYDENVDINSLHELTLYYIETLDSELCCPFRMLFNKKYCLIYGKFLKQYGMKRINILYYKQPSQIHKCNYKTIINNLWDGDISHHKEENINLKKLIANVNFGLLEKGGSTNQQSNGL